MEFVARSADLLAELGLVQGVVERRTTIPILSNVRIEAREGKKGGEVEIVATDLEVGVRTTCEAVVTRPGALTLPARRLHEIVRLLPDSEVQFNAKEGSWVSIVCERTKFRLAGAGVEDFPGIPDYDFKDSVTLPLNPLKSMIERVLFAISNEDPRFAIKGSLMIVEKGNVTMVSTDGHRLAFISRTGDVSGADKLRVLVPRKALAELLKFEPGPEGEVRFGVQGNHIFFKMGRRLLHGQMLEGEFPNYERVIPQNNDRHISVPAEALRSALGRVSLLSQERSRLVKLSVEEGKLILSAQNAEMGEAEETVPADYEGPSFQVGFNSRYFMDFLQVVGSDRVRLELKDEGTQGLLRPDGEHEWDYRYVVMPMRLS